MRHLFSLNYFRNFGRNDAAHAAEAGKSELTCLAFRQRRSCCGESSTPKALRISAETVFRCEGKGQAPANRCSCPHLPGFAQYAEIDIQYPAITLIGGFDCYSCGCLCRFRCHQQFAGAAAIRLAIGRERQIGHIEKAAGHMRFRQMPAGEIAQIGGGKLKAGHRDIKHADSGLALCSAP